MNETDTIGGNVGKVVQSLPNLREYIEERGTHRATLTGSSDDLRCEHPVHSGEHATNLSVNADKNQWYCFRHQTGGGILEWIAVDEELVACEEANHLGSKFPLVLERAADIAGVELDPDEYGNSSARPFVPTEKRDELERTMTAAADVMWSCYRDNEEMRAHVEDTYGFDADWLYNSGMPLIGFAPTGDEEFFTRMGEMGFTVEQMLEVGLAVKTSHGPKPFFTGRIVFPYYEHGRVRYFIGRRVEGVTTDDPWEMGKYKKLPVHSESKEYIHPWMAEPIYGVDTIDYRKEEPVLVVEGITDAMACHKRGISAISPVTVAFKDRHIEAVCKATRGRDVYIVMDEEESGAGLDGACRTAVSIEERGRASSVKVGRLPLPDGMPKLDIAEFFARGATNADLAQVLKQAKTAQEAVTSWSDPEPIDHFNYAASQMGRLETDHFYGVKDDEGDYEWQAMAEYLRDCSSFKECVRKIEHTPKKHLVALEGGKQRQDLYKLAVASYLTSEGEFVEARGNLWYCSDHTTFPLRVDNGRGVSGAFRVFLGDQCGLYDDSWSRGLFEGILHVCASHAVEREIGDEFLYHRDANALFFNSYDGSYYKVTSEGIERQRNGEEVFFLEAPGRDPFEYIPPTERVRLGKGELVGEFERWEGGGDLVHRYLCNRVNFTESSLSVEQQRLMLYVHLHAMPFNTMFDARPIMAWVGPRGSGKTVMLRSIGQFFHGEEYKESELGTQTERDMAAVLGHSSLAFFDNYDEGGKKWVDDMLASVATGTPLKTRKLYTNSELEEVRLPVWLGITSRSPPFRREDVASRCLVFSLRVISGYCNEGVFVDQLVEARDSIWSEYLENMQRILAAIDEHGLRYGGGSEFRMGEWVSIARLVELALDTDTSCTVKQLESDLCSEQAYFALEEEPVARAVKEWCRADPKGAQEWRSSTDLYNRLSAVSNDIGIPWEVSSAIALGQKLSHLEPEFALVYGMERKQESGSYVYRFMP